jgi:hypothetical protein
VPQWAQHSSYGSLSEISGILSSNDTPSSKLQSIVDLLMLDGTGEQDEEDEPGEKINGRNGTTYRTVSSENCQERGRCASEVWRTRFA